MGSKFEIGNKVKWVSSFKYKEGEVVAVVPAGERSGSYGYNPCGCKSSCHMTRDHESYIIGQRKISNPSEFYATNFWPVVSFLEKV